MAAFRAVFIVLALVAFFLVGAPLQRLVVRRAPRLAHQIPAFFCRCLLALLGFTVDIAGRRSLAGAVLTVANHTSWIDILALGTVAPYAFLAKREVANWPLPSSFARVQGTVFVDRQRRRTIPDANAAMANRMLAGRSVLLFPEGTTVDASGPGRFRSSHFAAARDLLASADHVRDVTIQPVAIAYTADVAAWIGDDDLAGHLWRVLRARPLRCRLSFAPTISYPRGADRKRIAHEARASIVAELAAAACIDTRSQDIMSGDLATAGLV